MVGVLLAADPDFGSTRLQCSHGATRCEALRGDSESSRGVVLLSRLLLFYAPTIWSTGTGLDFDQCPTQLAATKLPTY